MFNLYSKTRQLTVWNFARMVKLTYFVKALLAQYDAIVGTPIPAFCYRYSGDRVLFSQSNVFATSGTPRTTPIPFILSKSSVISSSPSESHIGKPPKYTWSKDPYCWYYLSDGVRTGISIDKIAELKITPYLKMKLKEPSYILSFLSPSDNRLYNMAGYESLRKAKEVAEWYYQEWLKVNR